MARQPKTNTEVNGYKYYRTVLTIGKDAKGNPIKKQFYGLTKGEAEIKKKQYLKDLEAGLNPDLSNQSLNQAMHTWLWSIEKHSGNKSSSFERYESIFRNYVEGTDLGILPVSDIKKLSLQNYYNALNKKGKSNSQIKNLHKLLNKFFGYAETEGYVIKNPCKGLKIQKNDEEDLIDDEDEVIETFTKEEIKRIIGTLSKNNKIRYITMFALFTGIRQGELLALKRRYTGRYCKNQ